MHHDAGISGLVARLLPQHGDSFLFESIPPADGRDVFEIESRGAKVVLRGSSPVAQASALNWYLKQYCQAHVSWCGMQLNLPVPLPPVQPACRMESPYRHRYYFNYCTFSYSMAWWDWARWEQEIDWMALHGINLPLAITGQEIVWQKVYRRFGLADREILDFIAGPAYLAWGWMGNLDGWGGPSPQSWIDGQCELQKRIVQRQRELGIRPVLPAFTGHVPAALARKFPGAPIRQMAKWAGNFEGTWMLDPADPLCGEIGKAFMEEQTRLYGTDHYYSCDSFNENCPLSKDPAYLDRMGKSLYAAMSSCDPEAVWVMQAWMFFFNPEDPGFWQEPQIKALLRSVPDHQMIVLDLHSDVHPLWEKTSTYHGKPWIWNVLHNFGAKSPIYGNLGRIANEPPRVLHTPERGNLIGMGLTPEGIVQNPVVYDLATEMMWRTDAPDPAAWVEDYARRRYGALPAAARDAWSLLLEKVYSRDGLKQPAPRSSITRAPTLDAKGPEYEAPAELARAWQLLASCADALGSADTYRYDLVDLGRQVLSNLSDSLQVEASAAYRAHKAGRLQEIASLHAALILDLDELLGTRQEFLLGKWIADARAWGKDDAERALLEWNARNQVTMWGNRESMLRGYARKEWNGLLRDFYLPRWQKFYSELGECLRAGTDFDEPAFQLRLRSWEEAWTHRFDGIAAAPQGDAVALAGRLVRKYLPLVAAFQSPATGKPAAPAAAGDADGLWQATPA
jgi:alpha-N-acetylglucosaminidase